MGVRATDASAHLIHEADAMHRVEADHRPKDPGAEGRRNRRRAGGAGAPRSGDALALSAEYLHDHPNALKPAAGPGEAEAKTSHLDIEA